MIFLQHGHFSKCTSGEKKIVQLSLSKLNCTKHFIVILLCDKGICAVADSECTIQIKSRDETWNMKAIAPFIRCKIAKIQMSASRKGQILSKRSIPLSDYAYLITVPVLLTFEAPSLRNYLFPSEIHFRMENNWKKHIELQQNYLYISISVQLASIWSTGRNIWALRDQGLIATLR